ncbi:DNA topology modulation protein [Listeria monocytogenes]|uniref:DNA topology modulation protein n=1 Tax=Listeria monocytogenes serotype 1/2a TaxID=1906951 RepID=A0A9P2DPI7_LISMN|nr:AAA family ATPase [Listeria monocytogenes]EAF3073552.1 DNA topology modulation protein [Listeria monocytogenes serotype 1/2a]EAE9669652.1 DNA topology modulation protein [Listeria monocytogenes]EAF3113600.1 DNA topology modulation protein [Listeria monocytogenes]EAF3117407.1 DNA topology modulation protein [Listeria monocytogenes]EAF3120144.1 DNA topology modulation protein [Listeria monocytogenes]
MKIRIIGSVGSGKTTLAKKLSEWQQIDYFETDRIVWKREETEVRRTDNEKIAVLNKILQQENWIIEGVHLEAWVDESFDQADVIIFLNLPKKQIHSQLIKRQIKQLLRLEAAHYQVKLNMLNKMFYWDDLFDQRTKPLIAEKMAQTPTKWLVVTEKTALQEIQKKLLQIISSRDIL